MFILGPIDTPDHESFTKAAEQSLGQKLPSPLPDTSFEAEEYLKKYLLSALETSLKDLSQSPRWAYFLSRETQLKFSVYVDEKGRSGILQYEFTLITDPFHVVCKHAYGSISVPPTPQA